MSTRYLTLTGGTIAYDQTGPADGPLIVCVPGMGDTRAAYRFLAPQLAEAGYRVVTMDSRGHGESSMEWPSYSPTTTAEDITALIDHLGGPAVIVGHSFAAGSAAKVAVSHPRLVDKLVLMGPAVQHTKPNPIMNLAAKAVTSNATLWTMYYKSLYPGDKPADFDDYTSELKAGLRRTGRMGPVRKLFDSFPVDPAADLSAVTAPTLVVMGSKDQDFPDPVAEAHRIAEALGGPSTAQVLDGAGHYPHAANADTTGQAILTFLDGN